MEIIRINIHTRSIPEDIRFPYRLIRWPRISKVRIRRNLLQYLLYNIVIRSTCGFSSNATGPAGFSRNYVTSLNRPYSTVIQNMRLLMIYRKRMISSQVRKDTSLRQYGRNTELRFLLCLRHKGEIVNLVRSWLLNVYMIKDGS